ncbi:hypothetical protein ACH5RR_026905 [Cinchona calisaya]|uniref:F-box domain-containing protein n=1 Tax=Cinchona calisaya TaxID=153742 RepID=A0ABD2Z8X1_9GENT
MKIITDDLIILILIRCPLKSNFRFKCVCKSWNRHLLGSFFRDSYISFRKKSQIPAPLLGFLRFRHEEPSSIRPGLGTTPSISFVPTKSNHDHDDPVINLDFAKQLFSLPESDFWRLYFKNGYDYYLDASPGILSNEYGNNNDSSQPQDYIYIVQQCIPGTLDFFPANVIMISRIYTLSKSLPSYGYDVVIRSGQWIPTYTVTFGMLCVTLADIGLKRWAQQFLVPADFHPSNPLLLVVKLGQRFFLCDVENPAAAESNM